MSKSSKSKSRRPGVHRQRSRQAPSLPQRYRVAGGPTRTLIALGFVILVFWISQIDEGARPFRVGQQTQSDINARVTFELEDVSQTEQRRDSARRNSPNVYVLNASLFESIRGRLSQLLNIAKENLEDYAAFSEAAERAGFVVGEEGHGALIAQTAPEQSSVFARWTDGLLSSLSHEYVVTPVERTAPSALLRDGEGNDVPVDASLIQPAGSTKHVTRMALELVYQFPEDLQRTVAAIVVGAIQVDPANKQFEPIYTYDAGLTRALMEERVAEVEPVTIPYQAGEPLVRAGKLTEADLALIAEEHKYYSAYRSSVEELRRRHLLSGAGSFVLVLVVTAGLCVYVLWYEPRVAQKLGRTLGLCALLGGMLLASRLLTLQGLGDLSVATVAMTAALLTILYNQRFALGVTSIQALLTCMVTGWDLGGLLTMISASWLCIFLLRDIRTRSKVISVGALAAALGWVLTVAQGFIDGQEFGDFILPRALLTGGGILMMGFVVQGILPGIERMFGAATSMTLLEWCDASRPLLKRLAQEAPGTYSHSLMLSNMAEAAAESIGGNGLLAKVGALYHDIGKTPKADYFTENQKARINRHDKLSPTMSLMIIRGHVKDGMEIAREYGLPRVLLPFIEEHHGTTLVKYFLRVASEQQSNKARGRHDREISESEFRYPGPKPRSRESAILMICDGSEGAVRALTEPSAARIESTVHKLVMDRLTDGQFDGCGITMQELHRVEESVVKTLQSTYHGRIAYPKDGEAFEPPQTKAGQEESPARDDSEAGKGESGGAPAGSSAPSPPERPNTSETVRTN